MVIALQQRPWWDHMWGATDGWGWMVFMMLFWAVLLILAVWLVLRLVQNRGPVDTPRQPGGEGRAEDIVRDRYARGEIDRDTYTRMLEDLRRDGEI